jgi:hypothetical protein
MSVWSIGGSGRRPSTVTIGAGDMFDRRLGKWDGMYQTQKGDWSFKREKADGANISGGRGSVSGRGSMMSERVGGSRSGVGFGAGFVDRNGDKDTEREKEDKKGKTVLKGMPLNSQEIWRHQFLGRFKVERRAAKGQCFLCTSI